MKKHTPRTRKQKAVYDSVVASLQNESELLRVFLNKEKLRAKVARMYSNDIELQRDNFLRELRQTLLESGTNSKKRAIEMITEELGESAKGE